MFFNQAIDYFIDNSVFYKNEAGTQGSAIFIMTL